MDTNIWLLKNVINKLNMLHNQTISSVKKKNQTISYFLHNSSCVDSTISLGVASPTEAKVSIFLEE